MCGFRVKNSRSVIKKRYETLCLMSRKRKTLEKILRHKSFRHKDYSEEGLSMRTHNPVWAPPL